jgi:hypothetical protein
MIRGTKRHRAALAAVALAATLASPAFAVLQGDCDDNLTVAINEVVRCSNIYLETQPLSLCPPCDRLGDGMVTIDDVVGSSNCFLDAEAANCRMSTPGPDGATPTNTPVPPTATNTQSLPTNTPTNTSVLPTNTPTNTSVLPTDTPTNTPVPPTETPTNTAVPPTATATEPLPTATPTTPSGVAICGNLSVDEGEECDDGGICTGSTNAGAACNEESDCPGGGVCIGGSSQEKVCESDNDCPGGDCVSCRPFGGDGCAANCTFEVTIPFPLVPGTVQTTPPSSNAFLHTRAVPNLRLPLSGSQSYTIGKPRNGLIPLVGRAEGIALNAIRVGSLACACVRGVEAKRCGGYLFEPDGVTQAMDCTLMDECAANGKKPCSFLHGPGNASSGIIGCDGLSNVNVNWVQDAGGTEPPPAPTPPAGSGPPIITFSGDGPAGSAFVLSTTRIGQATTGGAFNKCAGGPPEDFGPDGNFCTNDDPEDTRGNPNTLPLTTGGVSVLLENSYLSGSVADLGPFMTSGLVANCASLTSGTPSLSGFALAGGFTALNQPVLGDLAVDNKFVGQ